MTRYEYKVKPAPAKGLKSPGVKAPEARFAFALETLMNEMAAEGWEYQRADILPSEERQGLTSSHTVYRSVLVFRRPLATIDEPPEEPASAAETGDEPQAGQTTEADHEPDVATGAGAAEDPPQSEANTADDPDPEKTRS